MGAADTPASWLIDGGAAGATPEAMISGLVARLRNAGVPVWRFTTSFSTRHPEVYGTTVTWTESGCERSVIANATYESPQGADYTPIKSVMERDEPLRVRLEGGAVVRWPALRELAARGATDYFVVPLRLGDAAPCFYSCSTNRSGGFSEADLEVLRTIRAPLALRVAVTVQADAMERLLSVYLGPNAAHRVLEGSFRRGTGQVITAAVWYCDLRNFTRLTDQTEVHEVVRLLDQYFEAVAGPVTEHGGEILKFIGDAMLAIFEVGTGTPEDACGRALTAAEQGLAATQERFPRAPVRIGVALHYGDLLYGNIGARERLDFTAIGAVVNEVCRVEGLCKELGVPLLFTGAFKSNLQGVRPVPLTRAHLKGVGEARDIFTIPRYAPAAD
jgi:adenylate cyclase